MQGNDNIRRCGYVGAIALALVALFVWMTGNGWACAVLMFIAMALIAVVERIAERSLRDQVPRLEAGPSCR